LFTKKEPFIKQIAIYLSNGSYQDAYSMSAEFLSKFPDELIAHYLAAKSAYWTGRFEEARTEARKAFNLALSDDDLLTCAILAASAYYRAGEYRKGYDLLKEVEKKKTTPELMQMIFIFSLAIEDEREAIAQLEALQKLDRKVAMDFIKRFVGG
jgi:tetratricopeptide (TPR) repeat protein